MIILVKRVFLIVVKLRLKPLYIQGAHWEYSGKTKIQLLLFDFFQGNVHPGSPIFPVIWFFVPRPDRFIANFCIGVMNEKNSPAYHSYVSIASTFAAGAEVVGATSLLYATSQEKYAQFSS